MAILEMSSKKILEEKRNKGKGKSSVPSHNSSAEDSDNERL